MHPLLASALKELSAFGLNPSEWLVRKISLNERGPAIFFESIDEKDLRLKAQIKTLGDQKMKLQRLELIGL